MLILLTEKNAMEKNKRPSTEYRIQNMGGDREKDMDAFFEVANFIKTCIEIH